jgi:hypothetical protein
MSQRWGLPGTPLGSEGTACPGQGRAWLGQRGIDDGRGHHSPWHMPNCQRGIGLPIALGTSLGEITGQHPAIARECQTQDAVGDGSGVSGWRGDEAGRRREGIMSRMWEVREGIQAVPA